jgi:glycyl-tRNA synthetase
MAEPKVNELMEKIVSLCKRRGFIFQSSEIYGGINGFWDYGPLGAELKRNVKELWWRSMAQRENVVGLEASIIMHPKVWEASGHATTFTDLMVDCLLSLHRGARPGHEEGSRRAIFGFGAGRHARAGSAQNRLSLLPGTGHYGRSARR